MTSRGAGARLTFINLNSVTHIPSFKLQRITPHNTGYSRRNKTDKLHPFILFEQVHNSLHTLKGHKGTAILLNIDHVIPIAMNHSILLLYFLINLLLSLVLETLIRHVLRVEL